MEASLNNPAPAAPPPFAPPLQPASVTGSTPVPFVQQQVSGQSHLDLSRLLQLLQPPPLPQQQQPQQPQQQQQFLHQQQPPPSIQQQLSALQQQVSSANPSLNSVQQQLLAQQKKWQAQQQQQTLEAQQRQDVLLQQLAQLVISQVSAGPQRPPVVPPTAPPGANPVAAPSGEHHSSYEYFSKFCGVSFGKLRSADSSDINPGTGKARKIVSGDHASAGSEVQQQVLWPNRALNSLVVPSPPEFKSLTPAQFAAGESAAILTVLPPGLQGSPLAHRLMHLNKLFTYSFSYDWHSCLNLHKLPYVTPNLL